MYLCMYLDLTYHPFSPSISHRLLPNTPSSQIYILLSRANILSPVNAARLHSCGVTHWAMNSILVPLKTSASLFLRLEQPSTTSGASSQPWGVLAAPPCCMLEFLPCLILCSSCAVTTAAVSPCVQQHVKCRGGISQTFSYPQALTFFPRCSLSLGAEVDTYLSVAEHSLILGTLNLKLITTHCKKSCFDHSSE